MNAVHGDLANTEESFPAIVDLLSNGTTSKLAQTPPAVRGDVRDMFPLREAVVDAFPDDASLAAAAVGGKRCIVGKRIDDGLAQREHVPHVAADGRRSLRELAGRAVAEEIDDGREALFGVREIAVNGIH